MSVEGSGGFLSTVGWVVEWALIGVIAALVLVIVRMLVFGGSAAVAKAPVKPKRKPALVFLTADELAAFDGTDKQAPVYVALRGTIYDVSSRRDMYGVKGQGYNVLAGRDAARALAKHALDPATCNNANIDDLTPGELEALSQWEDTYRQKYGVVGHVVATAEEKQRRTKEEELRYAAETQRLAQAEAAASATTKPKL